MLNNRRSFLSKSVLAVTLGSLKWSDLLANAAPTPPAKGPLVIATWDNRKATAAAWEVLKNGGRALDAVEAGARVPEADPNDTSVGYGGFPDRDGKVTLDACIMDEFGNAGSVCFLQDIMHPISVARLVMEKTPHVMLSGEGALDFALKNGFKRENLLTPVAEKAWKDWLVTSEYKPKVNWERHDTIGIVAIDQQSRISGACTTSGMAFKMHGRIGDSPVLGAGMFSDNEVGAAACTGLGEMLLRTLGSFLVVEEMRRGKSPQKAIITVLKRIAAKYPEQARENQIGFVALDKKGRYGAYALQAGYQYAVYQNGENKVFDSDYLFK
jgi:N4-(beta-N-acetylglucosaminyl)-L-asparaginase